MGETCRSSGRRFAVVTTLRSPDYMMGLKELSCSLKKTNPDVSLIIVGAADDDNSYPTLSNEIRKFGEFRVVEDLRFPNILDARYSLNWIKLRLWQWEEFDSILIIDSDTIIRGDLTHLFHLPTHFAWAQYNGPEGFDANRGGLIMMRPCLKTYHAMLDILERHQKLQYRDSYAEQEFFTWFFRYTAFVLPLRYNLNVEYVDPQGLGPGGAEAVMLHFAHPHQKGQLFDAKPEDPAWPFLCYQINNHTL